MKNTQLSIILQNIGLSENEAKVYLAALSLGQTTILQISRTAEIKRTTVYSIIESLKQRGLINIEIKGWKQLFAAQDPAKLELILETQRQQFKNFLPEFSALYNLKGSESVIKYYEGLEAIKSIYESLLKEIKPHDDYLVISYAEPWFKLDPDYFQNYIERRAKLNINIRLLLQDSPHSRELKKLEKNYNEKIKFFPQKNPLKTNLIIIPTKIVFHQFVPPITAISIENKSIIQMHREVFEIIWRLM